MFSYEEAKESVKKSVKMLMCKQTFEFLESCSRGYDENPSYVELDVNKL